MHIPDNSWVHDKVRLTAVAHTFDKSIKLIAKPSWMIRGMAITIGPLHLFPVEWSAYQVEMVIPHEGRHTKQVRWFGLGLHPWVGLIPFLLAYAFIFFPIFLAPIRCYLEMDAERSASRYHLKKGHCDIYAMRVRLIDFGHMVCGKKYWFALPVKWGVPMFIKAANMLEKEQQEKG